MKTKLATGCFALALVLGASPIRAVEPAPAIAVSGALPKSGVLGQAGLEELGAVVEDWVEHGEKHRVTGVPLDKVLAAFGFAPGPMGKQVPVTEKRAGWRRVVVAVANDGYQVAFSCAELSSEIGATKALVSFALDGAPLGRERGPFRLVVLTDREPSRSVRNLERLIVVDVSQVPGPAKR